MVNLDFNYLYQECFLTSLPVEMNDLKDLLNQQASMIKNIFLEWISRAKYFSKIAV